MKSKISYSRFCAILTTVISGALLAGCIATVKEEELAFFILLAVLIILYVTALLFGPAYIKADSNYIVLGSLLRRKKIPVCDVESVELFQPTMGAIRIIGSGGFAGYWGMFKEGDIGTYYAFYGKSSDCFLLRMKGGKKYVLGCNQPEKMVDYIQSQIKLLKSSF